MSVYYEGADLIQIELEILKNKNWFYDYKLINTLLDVLKQMKQLILIMICSDANYKDVIDGQQARDKCNYNHFPHLKHVLASVLETSHNHSFPSSDSELNDCKTNTKSTVAQLTVKLLVFGGECGAYGVAALFH